MTKTASTGLSAALDSENLAEIDLSAELRPLNVDEVPASPPPATGKEAGTSVGSDVIDELLTGVDPKRDLIDSIKVGSVVTLANGKRVVVRERNETSITYLEIVNDELKEREPIAITTLQAGSVDAIRGVNNTIEPSIFEGDIEPASLHKDRRYNWASLDPGDQIFYYDDAGNVIGREEICAIKAVPGENSTIVAVDSIFYVGDKVVPKFNQRRMDREFTAPNVPGKRPPPEPRKCARVSSIDMHTGAKEGDVGLKEGVTYDVSRASSNLWRTLERNITRELIAYSDVLVDARGQGIPNEYLERNFESLLEMQADLRVKVDDLLDSLELLYSEAYLKYNGSQVKPESLRMVERLLHQTAFFGNGGLQGEPIKHFFSNIIGIIEEDSAGDLFSAEQARESLAELCRAMDHTLEHAGLICESLGDIKLRSASELIDGKARIENCAEEIYALIAEAQNPESEESIQQEGAIMGSYFSAEYLIRMVELGGRLVVNHSSDDPSKITGCIFYFPPGEVPDEARGVRDEYRKDPRRSLCDLVRVGDAAEKGTFRKLVNAMLLDLQRTEARYSYGEVLAKNAPSFGALSATGHRPAIKDTVLSRGADGVLRRWIPMELLIRPEERRKKIASIMRNVKKLFAAFEEQAAVSPEKEHIRERLAKIDEEKQLKTFANFARGEVDTKIITRFSLGSGNMTDSEYKRLLHIFEHGCKGLRGIATWGATTMLTTIDDVPTLAERKGGQAMLHRVVANASEDIFTVGVNTYDPEEIDEIVVEGLNNDEPIMVISKEGGSTFMTIADFDMLCRLYFDGTRIEGKPIWDIEAIKSRDLARLLRELEQADREEAGGDAGSEDLEAEPAFRNINVFGSGGGTIGREIQDLAEEAFDDPDSDMHIVLVKVVDEDTVEDNQKSSTDKYATNQDFIDRHMRRAREQGRPPYIHVVESAEELDEVMTGLGALEKESA